MPWQKMGQDFLSNLIYFFMARLFIKVQPQKNVIYPINDIS